MGKTFTLLPATAALLFLSACSGDPASSITSSAAAPATVSALSNRSSGLTLHPSGFGEHSFAAWKAGEGIQDSHGNADQALYFQKMTATETVAAGVARITGLEGAPVSALTGLQWEHRNDGWCGAGAPRWNISLTGPNEFRSTIFLGCAAAEHTPDPANPDWTIDTFPGLGAAISAALAAVNPLDVTISGLSILFDEGTTAGGVPLGPNSGFVFLDNIEVNGKRWTSPADNGSN